MTQKYEVWLNARHPKTLESVATVRVFAHADRLRAEAVLDHAQKEFGFVVSMLRTWQPGAIVAAEMHHPVRVAGFMPALASPYGLACTEVQP